MNEESPVGEGVGAFERILVELADGDADAAVDSLCEAGILALGVDAASVAVMSRSGVRETICASAPIAQETDRIQFSTGEGPCVSAFETGKPQFLRDTLGEDGQRWPAFTEVLTRNLPDIRAVYGFPLTIGTECVGSMDLIARVPGSLSPDQVHAAADAARTSARAVVVALARRLGHDRLTFLDEHTVQDRTAIYLAVGVISDRGRLSGADALALLRGRAFSTGRLADEVARDVLAGRVALP